MSTEKLFPEYLDSGSEGPPVAVLQVLLRDRDCNPASKSYARG